MVLRRRLRDAGALATAAAVASALFLTAGMPAASASTVVQTITVGSSPQGISSGGAHVWVANNGDGTVSELDALTPQAISFTGPGTGTVGGHATLTATGGASAPQVQQTVTVSPAVPAGDADISAALACPATLTGGHVGTCSLTIANAGPATATRITATTQLPPQLTISCTRCTHHGTTVTLTLAALAPRTSTRTTLAIGALFPGRVTLAITAQAREPDPNPANNTARQTITITKHTKHRPRR
jgi:hypothetical protein